MTLLTPFNGDYQFSHQSGPEGTCPSITAPKSDNGITIEQHKVLPPARGWAHSPHNTSSPVLLAFKWGSEWRKAENCTQAGLPHGSAEIKEGHSLSALNQCQWKTNWAIYLSTRPMCTMLFCPSWKSFFILETVTTLWQKKPTTALGWGVVIVASNQQYSQISWAITSLTLEEDLLNGLPAEEKNKAYMVTEYLLPAFGPGNSECLRKN